jgi:hypothetical protein
MSEMSERVSALEIKVENVEKSIQALSVNQKEHFELTLQIKERFDRQNGAIPHMQEDMSGLAEAQEKILSRMGKDSIRNANTSLKIKILWSLCALGVGSLITHLIHNLLLK